jgi:hypothetical protein
MNRDPEVYGHDADLFEPTRHLDGDGRLAVVIPETKDEGHNTFGFGRRYDSSTMSGGMMVKFLRNCVGRHLANDSLFIDCASILWALSIEPFYDHNGAPIIPSLDESINAGIMV